MTYVPVFTVGVIQPSNVAYRAVSISANYAPVWPSKAANTPEVVANLMEITATVGGLNITLPPANQVGNGTTVIWRNLGANAFTLVDQNNNTVLSIASGQVWAVYLQDDSTVQGTWSEFQFSTTSSSATPGPLAGLGLVAITTTLNQSHPVVSTAVNGYTVTAADRAEVLSWTSGAGVINLTASATLGNNFFLMLRNNGTGVLVVTPTSPDLIDNGATLSLNPTDSCFIVCSGAGFNSVGLGRSSSSNVSQIIIPVGGNTNVILTATQAANALIQFTGILTGSIGVIVPTNVASYHVFNNTTGAFNLTVTTLAGTGVVVPQGVHAILDCDGTNVVSADSVFTQAQLIACTAAGTNVITLTPVSGTALLAYVDQQLFTFTPANTSTGAVTVGVSALVAGNLFLSNGTTPVNGSMVVAGQPMVIMRVNALAGFVVVAGAALRQVAAILAKTGTAVSAPVDTNEDIVGTINVLANAVGPNGGISLRCGVTVNNNGNNKTIRVRVGGLGGTIILSANLVSTTGLIVDLWMTNSGATNAQGFYGTGILPGALNNVLINTVTAVDTTAAWTIVITAQKATAGDTMTLNSLIAQLYSDGT